MHHTIYAFFQYDYSGSDIRGEDYRELINYCFKHCAALSFGYRSKELAEEMRSFHPFISRSTLPEGCDGRHSIIWLQHTCFFYCNEPLRMFLLENAESLFDWISYGEPNPLPEDLCFYRQDGTGLLWSSSHDGECTIFLREDEAVPDFVSRYGWTKIEDENPYYAHIDFHDQKPFF